MVSTEANRAAFISSVKEYMDLVSDQTDLYALPDEELIVLCSSMGSPELIWIGNTQVTQTGAAGSCLMSGTSLCFYGKCERRTEAITVSA